LLEEYRTTLPNGAYVFIGNAGGIRMERTAADEDGVRFAFFEGDCRSPWSPVFDNNTRQEDHSRFGASVESMSVAYQHNLIRFLQTTLNER
jgi:hypothetical protein